MSDILTYKPVSVPNGLVAEFGMITQDGNIRLTEIVTTSVGAQEATRRAMEVAEMGGALSMASSDSVLAVVRSFFSGDGTLVNVNTSDNTFDGTYFDIFSEFEVYASLVSKNYEIALSDYIVLGIHTGDDIVKKEIRNPLNVTITKSVDTNPDKDVGGHPYITLSWDAINTYACTNPSYNNQTACEASVQSSYCRTVDSWPDSCSDPLLTTAATCTYTGCSDAQFTSVSTCLASGCADPVWTTDSACIAAGEIWTYPSVWTYPAVWTSAGYVQSAPQTCIRKSMEEFGEMEVVNAIQRCTDGQYNSQYGGRCHYSSSNDENTTWNYYGSNWTKSLCLEYTQTIGGWDNLYWAWFADDNIKNEINNQWIPTAATIQAHTDYNVMTSNNPSVLPQKHLETTSTSVTIDYADVNLSYGNGINIGQSTYPIWITHTASFPEPIPTWTSTTVTTYSCSPPSANSCPDGISSTAAACVAAGYVWTVLPLTTQALCTANGGTWYPTDTTTFSTVWSTYAVDMPIDVDYYMTGGFLPHGFVGNTASHSQPYGLYGFSDASTNNFPRIRWQSPQNNTTETYRTYGTPVKYRIYRAPYWKDGIQFTGSDYSLGIWKLVGEVDHTSETGYMYFEDDKQSLLNEGIRPFHSVYYKVTSVYDKWEWVKGINIDRFNVGPNKWDPVYKSSNQIQDLFTGSHCTDGQWDTYTACLAEGWCNGGGQSGNGNSSYNNQQSNCTSTGSGHYDNGWCGGYPNYQYSNGQCYCDGSGNFSYSGGTEWLCSADFGNWRCCSRNDWPNYTFQSANNSWVGNGIDNSWVGPAVWIDDNTDRRTHRAKGYFRAQSTEQYTFKIVGDDAIYLWIGSAGGDVDTFEGTITASNDLCSAPGSHGDTLATGYINLVEGEVYPIILLGGNHGGLATVHMSWLTSTFTETHNGTHWLHPNTTFHTTDGQDNIEGHPSNVVWSYFRT